MKKRISAYADPRTDTPVPANDTAEAPTGNGPRSWHIVESTIPVDNPSGFVEGITTIIHATLKGDDVAAVIISAGGGGRGLTSVRATIEFQDWAQRPLYLYKQDRGGMWRRIDCHRDNSPQSPYDAGDRIPAKHPIYNAWHTLGLARHSVCAIVLEYR